MASTRSPPNIIMTTNSPISKKDATLHGLGISWTDKGFRAHISPGSPAHPPEREQFWTMSTLRCPILDKKSSHASLIHGARYAICDITPRVTEEL